MYSKAQLIKALKKEIGVLEHLQSKITAELHGHKFTEKQRTIKELLSYLAAAPWKMVDLVVHGDMSAFTTMKEYTENFKPEEFTKILKENAESALKTIEGVGEDALKETITIFNGYVTGTRAEILMENMYSQLVAYKMQLFLQMKHAGLTHLGSMNLWAGKDAPST